MKKTLLLIVLTASAPGCALLKPESAATTPVDSQTGLPQITQTTFPYTVTGDADFPYNLHSERADAAERLENFYVTLEQPADDTPGDISVSYTHLTLPTNREV